MTTLLRTACFHWKLSIENTRILFPNIDDYSLLYTTLDLIIVLLEADNDTTKRLQIQ